jgi:iron(III) transport system substrate-binding protein
MILHLPTSGHHRGQRLVTSLGLLASLVVAAISPATAQIREVRVYSGRHYNTDKAIYEQFTSRTGIRVRLVESNDAAILQRLRSEGRNSPADLVILVDVARLANAAQQGAFQPVQTAKLRSDVPASLRDNQGRWYGLTRRVRAFVINPKIVGASRVKTYADLAGSALKGKLCLRDRSSVYNQSLVASQLVLRGEVATANWIRGMVSNLADDVYTGDIALARAVAEGECGLGVVNSYYIARMLAGDNGAADKTFAARLQVVYPNPIHVNVSGAGVTRYARNRSEAIALMEFLASPSGGEGYAKGSHEYPLRGFGNNPILRRFGDFRPDSVTASQLGANIQTAIHLMSANGWK